MAKKNDDKGAVLDSIHNKLIDELANYERSLRTQKSDVTDEHERYLRILMLMILNQLIFQLVKLKSSIDLLFTRMVSKFVSTKVRFARGPILRLIFQQIGMPIHWRRDGLYRLVSSVH